MNTYSVGNQPGLNNYSKYGSLSSNPGHYSSSAIDQHRNSIQQRIANLQAKILKKTNTQQNIYESTQQNIQDLQKNKQNPSYQSINKYNNFQTLTQHPYNIYNNTPLYTTNLPLSQQYVPPINDSYNNMKWNKTFDQIALRERQHSPNRFNHNYQPSNHNKAYPEVQSKRSIATSKNSVRNQNLKNTTYHANIKPYSNSNTSKSPIKKPYGQLQKALNQNHPTRSQLIQQRNQIKKQKNISSITSNNMHNVSKTRQVSPQNLQRDFKQLNKTISNLRSYADKNTNQPYHNLIPYHSNTQDYFESLGSTQVMRNTYKKPNQPNGQLYQMMKSILAGQQRLQKQIQILKHKQTQPATQQHQTVKNSPFKSRKGQKQNINSENNYTSIPQTRRNKYQVRNISPRLISKEKYRPKQPRQQKSRSRSRSKSVKKYNKQKQNSQISPLKRSASPIQRSNSALSRSKSPNNNVKNEVNNKNNNQQIKRDRIFSTMSTRQSRGKINKNKDKFDQLYKQAQQNRRLNQSTRVIVSQESISQALKKIRNVIQETQSQNKQTSIIYHQNNRYINDHLINTIELQKKKKSQLVEKIYQMCENKCVFK